MAMCESYVYSFHFEQIKRVADKTCRWYPKDILISLLHKINEIVNSIFQYYFYLWWLKVVSTTLTY